MNVRTFVLSFAVLATALLPAQVDPDGPAISPFRGMRQVDGGIEVQVLDDTWFALESVNGVETARLLKDAARLARHSAWKRITEDLPALFDAMGVEWQVRVDVEVRDLATGKVRTFEDVEMTGANRRRVKEAQREPQRLAVPAAASTKLTADAWREDLDVLATLLDTRFAYRDLRGVDVGAELRALRERLAQSGGDAGDGVSVVEFARGVDALLRTFGDGHSRLNGAPGEDNAHWLPCLIQQVDGGYVALHADRSALLSETHPFVAAIDGEPIAAWLAAAREHVTKGSEVMQARGAERGLRELSRLRAQLGLADGDTVSFTMRGRTDGGGDELRVVRPVASKKPIYGTWPRRETGLLENGEIGYLRIVQMDDDPAFLDAIDTAMQRFRETRGLIVDVRGNGGGTRDALRRLAPYFLPEGGEPVVGNAAAYLLEPGEIASPDSLANRYLYPAEWQGWSDAERAAIASFLKTFRPSWRLPEGRFSPWCFLLLDRRLNPNAFHYRGGVRVLIDRSCFSATDIFAAALQAIPGVELVGEATAGGSGRARGYRLPNSGLRLQLSTMASFRPDGTLFEGNGVVPDLVVATEGSDLVGRGDAVLQAAIADLRR